MTRISDLPNEILYMVADLLEEITDVMALRDSDIREFGLPLNEAIRRRFSFGDGSVVDALFWSAATQDEEMVRYILEKASSPFAIWVGEEEEEEEGGEEGGEEGKGNKEEEGREEGEGKGEEKRERKKVKEACSEEGSTYFVLGAKPTERVVQRVLEQGANLFIADHSNWSSTFIEKGQLLYEYSALSWLIRKDSLLKIEQLLQMGADPGLPNSYKRTAFDAVARWDPVEGNAVLRLFHKKEADNYFWIGYGGCSIEHLDDLSYEGRDGNTLIHLAAICSRPVDMVRMVLAAGVDINAKNRNEKTALELAFDYEQAPPELIKLFLESGAEFEMSSVLAIDSDRWTPEIHAKIAVWFEHVEPTYRGEDNETLLHLAVRCNMPAKYIERLLERGVDIDAQGSCSQTALHLAGGYGGDERYELLKEKGADMTIRDRYGRTPLDIRNASSRATIVDPQPELLVGIDEESVGVYLGAATDGW